MSPRTPRKLRPAAPLRIFNRATGPFREQLISLDPTTLRRWAESTTGLRDWGSDDGFFGRLDHNIDSLQAANLNTFGRFGARYVLHWKLTNRLRRIEALKQHPEILDIPIEAPLVIIGWYRTGTTFLHNVLAADPANRVAKAWELAYPFGDRSAPMRARTRRRRWATATFTLDQAVVPDQSDAHHVTPDSYEECFFLLENDLATITFFNAFGTWDYAFQVLERDMVTPYRAHKMQLQGLTAQRSADRWVLKCPWHLWNLDALLAVYPDARIVQTHRNVPKALASQCSLSARMTGKFIDNLDPRALGRFWADYFEVGMERGLRSRELTAPGQVYDLRLRDLIAHPIDTLRDVYEHFDMPFSDELADRFVARIAEQPTGRLGDHEYAIDEFGLTDKGVEERFAAYRSRFGV